MTGATLDQAFLRTLSYFDLWREATRRMLIAEGRIGEDWEGEEVLADPAFARALRESYRREAIQLSDFRRCADPSR